MLRITEEEFNEYYPDLKGHYDFFHLPPPSGISNSDFERRYLSNKLWRLNNLYSVIDKHGNPVTFVMNRSQHKVYGATRQHPRALILKSRQQGISTFWLVSYFDDAIFAPFMNIGLMAQGTDEAATLLERAKFLWDTLDPDVKRFIGVDLKKDNTKEFSFSNGSTIFIRVSFRSTTLQRLHVSEMGKIANNYPKRAREVKTGTLQALARGNTGVIESTAEGKNMFKEMWDEAVITKASGQQLAPKDFVPVFLSWLEDPDCLLDVPQTVSKDAEEYFIKLEKDGLVLNAEQRNFWIAQYRELGDDVYQEYPATPEEAFRASRDGTYYARQFNADVVDAGRVMSDLYDPNLPVDVYFDLGVDDYTVMLFVQWYDGYYRVVAEYWNNGYGLYHYLDYIRDGLWLPGRFRDTVEVRALMFPHDIAVRELGSARRDGTAKSRLDIVQEWIIAERLSWYAEALPKVSILDGIEAVRRMMKTLYISTECEYLIDCLLNYSREFDDKLQVWKTTPLHNEYSHGADVLRQLAANAVESNLYNPSKLRSARAPVRSSGYDV